MAVTIPAPATLSVSSAAPPSDVTITLTFTPGTPLGATEVDVTGDPALGALLALLDEALIRLCAYMDGYSGAWCEDAVGAL